MGKAFSPPLPHLAEESRHASIANSGVCGDARGRQRRQSRRTSPQAIALTDAKNHIGDKVVLEFVVESARLLDSGKFCFLNSQKDFRDRDNFTTAIHADALAKLTEAGIKDPAEHYRGKKIRVTGKLSLYNDKPQIVVSDPQQIVLVVSFDAP